MTARFDYYTPQSWDEALSLLAQYGTDARLLAGGTDLMIQLERKLIAPKHVISMDRIPGWDALTVNGGVTINAGTTYRQLEKTPALFDKHKALIEASRQVGGVQVRNVGTVAGNLCNASPAADSVPPLLVMDTTLTLVDAASERQIPAYDFITGRGETVLREGELLHTITIPPLPDQTATVFLKAGRRQAMEISFVSVAARLTLAENGTTIETARIALGAAAPRPVRATTAEQALEGETYSPDAVKEAAFLAVQSTDPISDVRASAEYRQHLVQVMVRRALEKCYERL